MPAHPFGPGLRAVKRTERHRRLVNPCGSREEVAFRINHRLPQLLQKLPCAPATAESESTHTLLWHWTRRAVHVEGLRVADASIMPIVAQVKPNASLLMMGAKTADLIQRRVS